MKTLYQAMRQCYRKSGFPTEKMARKKVANIVRGGGVRMYVYGCTQCGNYHLTKNSTADGKVF